MAVFELEPALSSKSSSSQRAKNDSGSISSTLLERMRAMRPEAWGRFVEVYTPVVYGWCRGSGLNEHDASDVVQEVFTSVARGVSSFRHRKPADSFRAWLATITRNRIRDFFRRQHRLPAAVGGTDAQQHLANLPEPSEAGSSQQLDAAISRRILELVRAEFEERTWDAFWRTVVEGQSPNDVAADLSVSVFVVYQAKSRVLRRLRERLGELPD